MTPRVLQTLVAISEIGSFARAAEHLNLTLSAVSMQMKGLEAELGAELFDRATRPPRLTPLGRAAATRARDILAGERSLRDLCRPGSDLAGDYRIGFILTAGVRILPGFLGRARAEAPEARFVIETGLSETLAQRVARGELDAAVITGGEPEPGLRLTPLAEEELVYALPPGAATWSAETCFERLAFLQFAPGTGIGRLVAGHLAQQGLEPRERVLFDGIEAIMECVATGIGFTALPQPDVERYAGAGVSVLPMRDPPLTRRVVLATLAGSRTDRERDRLALLARGTGGTEAPIAVQEKPL
ncbi:MAG: LysR family transcriptional regulator [Pseudomonadota bacterium]